MADYRTFAIETAAAAGQELLQHFGDNPPITRGTPKEVKSLFDEVADQLIKERLEECFPEHSYLTEETGLVEKSQRFRWIIDPLDGTGNFVNGNPLFAISIALWVDAKPVLAVIEAPALQERFVAEGGQGAERVRLGTGLREPVRVSETTNLDQAYLTLCEGGVEDRQQVLETIQRYYRQVKDMRKLGSAALELAWVGLGRADAYITHDISLWDIAAGVLFVHEAGGKLLDFEGQAYDWPTLYGLSEINLMATNGRLSMVG